MSRQRFLSFAVMMALIVAACSIVKKDDPAQNVRTFLSSFQSNLGKSDQEILKQFRVRQSPEAVLAVIRILQNKEKYFLCDATFAKAGILLGPSFIHVTIPATFTTNGLENRDTQSATLEFWLESEGKSYVISRLGGEAFYNTFTKMKNKNEWGIMGKTALESRQPIYDQARELENKFDSIIFYATYKEENYFYVVKGEWENYFLRHDNHPDKNLGTKMGLAKSNGDLVIPIEYDLIGTIGFEAPNIVEVKKDGKVGFFDLQSERLIVEPKYDMIVPAPFDNTFAIVKQDSVVGWLTNYYALEKGFPSEDARKWFEEYAYLRKNLRLAAGIQVYCEIPSQDYAGNGILMPPSYLVKHRVFDEIEHGITTTDVPLNSYTEYKETGGSWLQRITDGLSALTTSIEERYLGGREEFYNSNKIVFIDSNSNTMGMTEFSGTEISMRAIDSTLLEVKSPHDWWFLEEGVCVESNLYFHRYFKIGQDSITELTSHRLFPETQFVKLDSSYITGKYIVHDYELDVPDTTSILSLHTLSYMRDEILASYGYRFPGTQRSKRFDTNWYLPVYDDIADFSDFISDIDRHNIDFLERIMAALPPEEIVVESADRT